MAMNDGIGEVSNPCRRRILSGLAALVATANLPSPDESALGPHDQTILYLKRRFDAAAEALARSTGRRQAVLFRGMSAFAAAMTVTPAHRSSCITMKREVAAWAFVEGGHELCLSAGLVRALVASALRDENRTGLR